MVKKSVIVFLCAVFASACVLASDNGFIQALKTCSSYTDSGSVNTSGLNVQSTKKILGFQGDRCVYVEKISMTGMNSNITCKFTKTQINELVSVMEAYNLVQKYSGNGPDLSDLESAQNNPVSKVWSKYVQDGSTCAITTGE